MNDNFLLPTGETVDVGVFRPDDADGISRLFRAVYGDEYPIKMVYDPEQLRAAFESGENVPVVARLSDGEVVGAVSLFRSTPNPGLYESGQGLVLPAHRGFGINKAMLRHLLEVVVPGLGIGAVFGESVCNHPYNQRTTAALGYVETGLEVDLMPHEAYSKAGQPGRVSVLPQFRLYESRHQTVSVPAQYLDEFGFLYGGLADDRTILPSFPAALPEGTSEITSRSFDFARVARIAVTRVGADFGQAFAREEEECLFNGMLVIQAWLSLADISVAAAVEHLRGLGYFFGGLLVRWFGADAALMQRVITKPDWGGIVLHTDRARAIGDIVHRDWERAKV